MAQQLIFDGLPKGRHTWFETREEITDDGPVGGDIVQAPSGSSFALDYVAPKWIEYHTKMGYASIVNVAEDGEPVPDEPEPIEPDEEELTDPNAGMEETDDGD